MTFWEWVLWHSGQAMTQVPTSQITVSVQADALLLPFRLSAKMPGRADDDPTFGSLLPVLGIRMDFLT